MNTSSEMTSRQKHRLFVGTWNVAQQTVGEPLDAWLSCDSNAPHIYAIGLQELELREQTAAKGQLWIDACRRALHPNADYSVLRFARLVGDLLVVFVRNDVIQHVTNVWQKQINTLEPNGVASVRGGVMVGFEVGVTSVCFVSCHLAPHLEQTERRNRDYDVISAALRARDLVYFMGDLNYRLEGMEAREVKRQLLMTSAFERLLRCDQLRQQMANNRVFVGYREGDVRFAPTYKYDLGSDGWDSSAKERAPAWCDRVLWRQSPHHSTALIAYRSHPSLRTSDHKPVSALFETLF